jgi:hypothetical protein
VRQVYDFAQAAFANVTADYDQLTSLLEDFFERMADNTTETLLRDYLLIKASRWECTTNSDDLQCKRGGGRGGIE